MGTALQHNREQKDYCIKKPDVPIRSGVGVVRGRSKITNNAMTTTTTTGAANINDNTSIIIPTPTITNTTINNYRNIESLIKACEEEEKRTGDDGGGGRLRAKTSVVGVFGLNSDFNYRSCLVLPRSNALGRSTFIFPISSTTTTTNNNTVTTISTTISITTVTNTISSPISTLNCCIKACENMEGSPPRFIGSDAEDPRLNTDDKSLKCPTFCEGSLLCRGVSSESFIMTSFNSGFAAATTTDTTGVAICCNNIGGGGCWAERERWSLCRSDNHHLKPNSHRPNDNLSRLCHLSLPVLTALSYDHDTCQTIVPCPCRHHYPQHHHHHHQQHQHHQQYNCHYHYTISNNYYIANYNIIFNNINVNKSYKQDINNKHNNICINNNNNHCYTRNNSNNVNIDNRNINIFTTTKNNIHAITTTNTINHNTTINTNTTNNNSHTTNINRNRKPQSLLFTLYHQFISAFFLHSVLSSRNVIFVAFTMVSLGMLPATSQALHLQGVWKSDNFFLFLAKFGFQKTDLRDLEHTQGIIYGQVFSHSSTPITNVDPHSSNPMLTLVLVDSEYFMEYYGNRTSHDLNRCPRMFDKIDTIAFDYKCQPKGLEDFLRKVPCLENHICVDEDDPKDVIDGFQFTYRIRDLERPRFWYLSLAACHRNDGHNGQNKSVQCKWMQSPKDIEIAYDIWLVNGHPSMKHINPFEHQFSFERHDVAEIYLIALLFYSILLGIWLWACNKLIKHPVTKLLTLTIVLETLGILLNCVHVIKFAFDGIGVNWLSVVGNGIDVLSECLFMLLVLVIAKGWAITNMYLEGKWVIFSVWGLYTVLNAVLFVWNLTEIDIISNTGEWHTGPGYLTLVFRLTIMLWFLYELRWTFLNDPQSKRLLFFQHFGAGILVWFVYLPVLVMVSLQISALWRYKTILSISFAANFLSAVCIVHLLWPSHSVLYLIKQDELIGAYEMEVTGFLEEPENSSAPVEVLEEEPFEKLSKKQDGSSLLKTLSKKNGQVPSDKEFLLD